MKHAKALLLGVAVMLGMAAAIIGGTCAVMWASGWIFTQLGIVSKAGEGLTGYIIAGVAGITGIVGLAVLLGMGYVLGCEIARTHHR